MDPSHPRVFFIPKPAQWVAFLMRHAWWVVLFGWVTAVLGARYSVELYKNLKPDIEELLPTTARSVLDLGEVSARLRSIDNLGILIDSEDPVASRKFVDDLVVELQKLPPEVSAGVEYKIQTELSFFEKRQALYLETKELHAIERYLRHRIDYETQLYNPLNIFSEEELPEPAYDFAALEKKYASKLSGFSRFPQGYYATPDEKRRLVLVNAPSQSVSGAHLLKDAVLKVIDAVGPERYDPKMRLRYTSNIQDILEEHSALLEDLELSTIIVAVLVTLALWIYYRSLLGTLALMGSLLIGTVWTFGVSYFAVGYLNANSAFLGSIVMGNGINFGIILLARYIEERRLTRPPVDAMATAVEATFTSTSVAALAAGLAYGSLMLTGFRGFKQFGVIGLIGMVLCWLSAFVLMPAYLAILERWIPLIRVGSKNSPTEVGEATSALYGGVFSSTLGALVTRFPRAILWISAAMTVVSLLLVARVDSSLLETDLTKLRDARSMTQGSGYLTRYMDEILQRYGSPVVILPRAKDQVPKIVSLLREQQAKDGATSLIASVSWLGDFLPQEQNEKIATLERISVLLTPEIRKKMGVSEKSLVDRYLTHESLQGVKETEMPPLVLDRFTERDGTLGSMILVEPPMTGATGARDPLIKFVSTLRDIADQVAPGTPVAGRLPVTADMIAAISVDGPRATFFAFLAVIFLVIVLFREVGTIALTLFALLAGVLWMLAITVGVDLKINFLNFIAFPITFGIGVDYGVNVFSRYRAEGPGQMRRVIGSTGGAVGLASLTTMIGYGSLLIAGNRAFVSFGKLAVLGEVTCILAAIVSLPAYLEWRDQKRRRT